MREILKAKEWHGGSGGSYPARVVLVKWSEQKFSTHLQIDGSSDNLGKYLAYGDYYRTREDAEQAFKERVI